MEISSQIGRPVCRLVASQQPNQSSLSFGACGAPAQFCLRCLKELEQSLAFFYLRLRQVRGCAKWWLLRTRQIYMSCSPSGNCKGMYRRCLLSPQRSNIALGKNLYQNQMHAGRFSKEGCIPKGRHQMSSVFWLGHDPLPSTDNNPSA